MGREGREAEFMFMAGACDEGVGMLATMAIRTVVTYVS